MTDITQQTQRAQGYFLPGAATVDGDGVRHRDFTATPDTESPWGRGFQHGAPPSALVTHLLESVAPADGRLVRVSVDLLGAVPLGELHTAARIVRPGRRICLVEAVVTDPAGRDVARGSGWWVHHVDTSAVETAVAEPLVPRSESTRSDPEDPTSFVGMWASGYIDTLEVWSAPGQAWVRSPLTVVAGVPDSPWVRLMGVADTANGTNPTLDPGQWQFMNTDITVNLHRLPRGEWTGIRADANYGPDGVGLTVSRLFDEDGPVGTCTQALMLNPL